MITTHWVPWVNSIREPGRSPTGHHTDPTARYDVWSDEPAPAGE
jgi:hypothetical protein